LGKHTTLAEYLPHTALATNRGRGVQDVKREDNIVPIEHVESRILLVRGRKVMLDRDLAELYGVTTTRLNEQVQRNLHRFPPDFMFQLTKDEMIYLSSQIAISKRGRGGRRYAPYVFTEHGAVMLASVLNSPIAVEVSVLVVRAFVRMRQALAQHAELRKKIDELEKKYDRQFRAVFEAIRELMTPASPDQRSIGFRRRNHHGRGRKGGKS
jgi:hypothetical protein